MAAELGVLNYLLYLNKEIALAFFISYVLMEAWEALTDKSRRKDTVCGLAAAVFAFAFCFAVMKLTMFKGMGNSYHQMSIDAIASINRILFMLYSALYNGLFAMLAFFVLPVVRWKYLGRMEKKAYIYIFLSFFIMIFAIAYTISVREDFGKAAIRQHLRYLEPLFPLFFALSFSALDKQGDTSLDKWEKGFLLIFAVLAYLVTNNLEQSSKRLILVCPGKGKEQKTYGSKTEMEKKAAGRIHSD